MRTTTSCSGRIALITGVKKGMSAACWRYTRYICEHWVTLWGTEYEPAKGNQANKPRAADAPKPSTREWLCMCEWVLGRGMTPRIFIRGRFCLQVQLRETSRWQPSWLEKNGNLMDQIDLNCATLPSGTSDWDILEKRDPVLYQGANQFA